MKENGGIILGNMSEGEDLLTDIIKRIKQTGRPEWTDELISQVLNEMLDLRIKYFNDQIEIEVKERDSGKLTN